MLSPLHLITSPSPLTTEYRLAGGSGTRVVRVFLHSPTPRVMFFVEGPGGPDNLLPTSLFMDEIEEYVQDATRRQKGV